MTEVVPTIERMREISANARRQFRSIACVPTMGALHVGHGRLIDQAREIADIVVVTLFVNPIQFDQPDDYGRYARQLEADRVFCEARNVDILFAPSAQAMYPVPSAVYVDAPELSRHLCGAFRPGHFRGVATVVAKLFNIVQPDSAYFGEKDAQQLAIISRMVTDLNFPIRIVTVPTVREADGLALSSRNQRLTAEEHQIAPVLFQALTRGRNLVEGGERQASKVKDAVLRILAEHALFRPEYVEVVDAHMQPMIDISAPARLAAAVWLGSTRLIDNVAVGI